MPHRESIRAYLEGLTITGTVIDWGCGAKPVMNYVQGDKAMFHTIDKNPKVSPNTLADITKSISLPMVVNQAFCMEVLEHVKEPLRVLDNIYNYLEQGGLLHLSVPFLYPIHSDEDYWRFTDQGISYLLQEAGFEVEHIEPTENSMGWIVRAKKI